jgi:hypothetical protein
MPFNEDGTRKPNLIVDTEKLKKGQRKLVEGIANANKPNMSHGPDLYMPKEGPFNMKPGNAGSIGSANNTPGSFRADSNAMLFASSMPKYELPKNTEDGDDNVSKRSGVPSINLGVGTRQEKLGNRTYVKPGDTVNVSPDRINRLVQAGFRRPENPSDSLYLSNTAYNTTAPSGAFEGPSFERAKDAYNSRLIERQFPEVFKRRNQLNINEVSLSSPGFRNIITPYSKRSGNKPNMTKPLYGVVKPMFFKKNKKKIN